MYFYHEFGMIFPIFLIKSSCYDNNAYHEHLFKKNTRVKSLWKCYLVICNL